MPSLIELLLAHAETAPVQERLDPLRKAKAQVSLAELVELVNQIGLESDRVLISAKTDAALKSPTVGGRIKYLRQKADISQETLAARIGVPTGTVTQWETGRRMPTFKMIVKLCKAFDVDLNTFSDCDLEEEGGSTSDKSSD